MQAVNSSVQGNPMFDPVMIREAARRARKDASTLDAILAQQVGITPHEVLLGLGRTFHYPVHHLGGETALVPDLDVLGLPDCRRLSALVVKRNNARVLLFVDPSDDTLQRWADARAIAVTARELVLESELLSALVRLEALRLPCRACSITPLLKARAALGLKKSRWPGWMRPPAR